MKRSSIMLIAGEASGDLLAAELVQALKAELATTPHSAFRTPHFFGAGGSRMAESGVELAFDMTQHAVVGLMEALRNFGKFKRLFNQLLELATTRQPDAIICVDFSGFNRRFAAAVRRCQKACPELNWEPKIIQYVSPQVWASRPKRAELMARDIDLLLSIFPFEKDWYAQRVPNLRVDYVGNPIVDRYRIQAHAANNSPRRSSSNAPLVLLLPGSRQGELTRHLPVMMGAAEIISKTHQAQFRMVLPNASLAKTARALLRSVTTVSIDVQTSGLSECLAEAALAIASTGTVTLECAYCRVPTVAIYKTSWSTYQIAKRVVTVRFLAMPNLLANELIFPEFIQHEATAEKIAGAALTLLTDPEQRRVVQVKLERVIQTLGEPGASQRAARAILGLFE